MMENGGCGETLFQFWECLLDVGFEGVRVDQYIVDVSNDVSIEHSTKNLINKGLEEYRGIS